MLAAPALDYVISVAVVALCTAISLPLRSVLETSTFAMLYLLGVLVVSMRCHRRAAILNALLSVTAFYYFCIPIHNTLVVEDSNYLITLIAMLVVALVISTLTFKVQSQAAEAMKAEIAIQTERTRNSFLSAVSHDIKTPLASIYGAATSLLEEEGRLLPADRRELIESISNEAERLNRVVTNLLEMTKLDAGVELRRNWYPVEEIVSGALARLEKTLHGHRVEVQIPPDLPLIWVDDVLLEQVFMNLLENVAKYTPEGTPVEVTAVQDGQNVVVSVRDRGPGFSPGDESRVFEKFFRGKSDGVRGVGLGLAICRAIVQRHQGTISAANRLDGGVIVSLELPIGGAPPNVEAVPESAMK
jgi:two-component system sensor histidine kinase KdpD